jgi:hypothetical protein
VTRAQKRKSSKRLVIKQNSYPLKDWHFEHMQKTVVKYLAGISEYATPYQKRMHNKYNGNLAHVRRSINFDIKHGVTCEEVITFFDEVRNDSSFSDVRKSVGSGERLDNLHLQLIDRQQQYTF